jgi:ribosome-binding protein aMBF1 (putative translation factor)
MTDFFTCDICGTEYTIEHIAYIDDEHGTVCKTCKHYGVDKIKL